MAYTWFQRFALLAIIVVLWAVLDGVDAQSTNPRGGRGSGNPIMLILGYLLTSVVVAVAAFMVLVVVNPGRSPSGPPYTDPQASNFTAAMVTGFVGSIVLMVIFWDAFFLPILLDYPGTVILAFFGSIVVVAKLFLHFDSGR